MEDYREDPLFSSRIPNTQLKTSARYTIPPVLNTAYDSVYALGEMSLYIAMRRMT